MFGGFYRLSWRSGSPAVVGDEGYPSLFEFCVAALGLKEAEAFNRIRAARLAVNFPGVLDRFSRLSRSSASLPLWGSVGRYW